ncbi:MAG: aminoglycoside phosphotransferase family protein [Wenzhouxiangellaceae bacterium]
MTMPQDHRADAARAFALDSLKQPPERFEPASTDASFRRYFRYRAGGKSWIVMDAPPERESLEPFIDIVARLASAGLHVPRVLAEDRAGGFLLLDDLGDQPWHQVLNESNAERDEWERVCMTLIRWALDQPKVFVHRDFMPRNLMKTDPNPGVLDFQDAVLGPISYDPVCLFRDAFLSWPPERVDGWLERYRQRALDADLPVPGDPELWRRGCDLMGVQRHLKVLGIFARIRYRDGKPRYLDDAPRFFEYLAQAMARNPELRPLARLLDRWRERAALASD